MHVAVALMGEIGACASLSSVTGRRVGAGLVPPLLPPVAGLRAGAPGAPLAPVAVHWKRKRKL